MEQIRLLQGYRVEHVPTNMCMIECHTVIQYLLFVQQLTVRLRGSQGFMSRPDDPRSSCRGVTFSTLAAEELLL